VGCFTLAPPSGPSLIVVTRPALPVVGYAPTCQYVFWREFMAEFAVRLCAMNGSATLGSTSKILGICNSFQMARIAARGVAAQVINN
jgi:hypothetical protein